MTVSVDLPVVRLEPPRARIATTWDVTKDAIQKYPRSVGTAWDALATGHASDHSQAQLSDSLRTLSVAAIAGMGSLGVSRTGGFLPFVLGGLSWLGAMKITPLINNGLAYIKTGVNQNMRYVTSNNDVRPLFQDPGFLPMQVIDKNLRLHWAEHLGIDRENPDRPSLLKDKLKQLTVQVHTWWMLVAGFATPILSALICDKLETPLRNAMISHKVGKAQKQFETALKSGGKADLERALRHYVETIVGPGTEVSPVAKWWGEMQHSVGEILHLKGLNGQKMIHGSDATRFETLSRHLNRHLQPNDVRAELLKTLQQARGKADAFIVPVKNALENPEVVKKLHPSTVAELKGLLAIAQEPAEATLVHLEKLAQKPTTVAALQKIMEEPVIANFERLQAWAHYQRAKDLAGNKAQYETLVTAMDKSKQMFSQAFNRMGASPKDLLTNMGKSLALRAQWLKRYPIGIGGTVLAASVLFTTFMLGEDFGAPPTSGGGSNE